MSGRTTKLVFWAVLLIVAALIWTVAGNKPPVHEATYSQFVQQVDAGNVSNAVILAGNSGATTVKYRLHDGTSLQTILPADYRDLLTAMQQKMVNIEIQDAGSQWKQIVVNSLPFLLLLAFWFGMMLQLRKRPAGPGAAQ